MATSWSDPVIRWGWEDGQGKREFSKALKGRNICVGPLGGVTRMSPTRPEEAARPRKQHGPGQGARKSGARWAPAASHHGLQRLSRLGEVARQSSPEQ